MSIPKKLFYIIALVVCGFFMGRSLFMYDWPLLLWQTALGILLIYAETTDLRLIHATRHMRESRASEDDQFEGR